MSGELAAAFLFFDGDAGVISDFLFEAGDGVEEGGLSDVGVAGECDDDLAALGRGLRGCGCGGHECRNLFIESHLTIYSGSGYRGGFIGVRAVARSK